MLECTLVPSLFGLDTIHRIKLAKFINYLSLNLSKYLQHKI